MIRVVQRQNRAVVRTQAFSRGESFLTSRTIFRGHRRQTVWDVRPLFNRKGNGEGRTRGQGDGGRGDGATGRQGEHQHHRIFLSLCRPVAKSPRPPLPAYCDPLRTPFLKTSVPLV